MTNKRVATLSAILLKRGTRARSHGFVLGGEVSVEGLSPGNDLPTDTADRPGIAPPSPRPAATLDQNDEVLALDIGARPKLPPERGPDPGDRESGAWDGREPSGSEAHLGRVEARKYNQAFPFDPFFGSSSYPRNDRPPRAQGGSPIDLIPSSDLLEVDRNSAGFDSVDALESPAIEDVAGLGPQGIIEALRQGERSRAERLLGKLAGLSEDEVERVLYHCGGEVLAAVCRYIEMEQLHFVSLFIMTRKGSRSTETVDAVDLEQILGMFDGMSRDRAERLLVTWRQQPES